MKLLSGLKAAAKGTAFVVKVATPLVFTVIKPESLINVAAGAVLKHGTKFDNQNIPVVSIAGSTLCYYLKSAISTGDWVAPIIPSVYAGATQAGAAWAIHQSAKVPAQQYITDPVLASKVGPGNKFSL